MTAAATTGPAQGPRPASSTPATAGKRKKTPAKDAESDRDSDEDSEETDEDEKDASLFTQYKGNAATLQERLNHIGHLKQEIAKIEAMRWMINRVPPQGLTHSEWHFCAAAWEKACAQTAGRPDLCKVLKHAVQSDRSCPGLFRMVAGRLASYARPFRPRSTARPMRGAIRELPEPSRPLEWCVPEGSDTEGQLEGYSSRHALKMCTRRC